MGLESIYKGLSIFAQFGLYPRLEQMGHRATQELKSMGLDQESQQVEEYFRKLLEGVEFERLRQPSDRPPKLPPKCPYCGGKVDPRHVEWVDRTGALCEYCGSMIEASGTI
jgi:hypothetical protein